MPELTRGTALCPGTYDPVTFGHLDIIGRAANVFDRVVVAVVNKPVRKGSQTVFSDTPAARATSATVTCSKPRSTNSRSAASAIVCRTCCFFSCRSPLISR